MCVDDNPQMLGIHNVLDTVLNALSGLLHFTFTNTL